MKRVEGVVLAAGLSSRMNSYKMALPLGDGTVIQKTIESLVEIVERVHVVVGWKAEKIRELLGHYAKVEFVINEGFRAGMFSSIKAGIARVRTPRFFLLPGDYPLIGAEVYMQMLAVTGDIVIPTFQGRKGHPVLFHSSHIPEILGQPDGTTLRDYITMKGYTAIEVETEAVLLDVDTPEDYDRVRATYQRLKGDL